MLNNQRSSSKQKVPYFKTSGPRLFTLAGCNPGSADFADEMILAVWLIVKGFNRSAIASQATTTKRQSICYTRRKAVGGGAAANRN
jgi:hypothetical protein